MSEKMGILLTKEISKFLEHRLIHHGNNREAHKELLQRVNKRLEGLKLKCLSRAYCNNPKKFRLKFFELKI